MSIELQVTRNIAAEASIEGGVATVYWWSRNQDGVNESTFTVASHVDESDPVFTDAVNRRVKRELDDQRKQVGTALRRATTHQEFSLGDLGLL